MSSEDYPADEQPRSRSETLVRVILLLAFLGAGLYFVASPQSEGFWSFEKPPVLHEKGVYPGGAPESEIDDDLLNELEFRGRGQKF